MNNADMIEKLANDIARLTAERDALRIDCHAKDSLINDMNDAYHAVRAERDALRDEVDELKECAHIGANTIQMYVNEVERLREALMRIEDYSYRGPLTKILIPQIAREALEVKP